MKTNFYPKCFSILAVTLCLTVNLFAQPTITGPLVGGLPATLGPGVTIAEYFTDPMMTNYQWAVSSAGTISPGTQPHSTIVTWTNPTGNQTVSVTYTENISGIPAVMIIQYYPFPAAIDPAVIPQFVDPLPHFAAGLRVDARAGGNLLVKAVKVQQIALSTGTPLATGVIGASPTIGLGNYAAYAISKDNGVTFGPAMWPAQTIEAKQGFPLTVQYRNDLFGVTYDQFNILADQTLMMRGYQLTGNPKTEPYKGDIPMVVHLHGGEMPSGSDGGPDAWFTPGYALLGPGFIHNASSLSVYPNDQEATTLWYHPHDDGLTRINVYTGLAGYYFLRGADEEAAQLPGWSGDDKVLEVTPAGKSPTFNGPNSYLPEVEIAIQDRMFNVEGGLYWPVAPTNPELHPFWTPEFVGDVMTVNGKSWPYLSVAPRKYRFRFLEGCNARFLNMWLALADGTPGLKMTVIGGEGGLLATPVVLDPALGQYMLMAPGQRYDVIIDFTGVAPGTTFTLMNNAGAPYPGGTPVVPGITDRIMQFVVNGQMVSALDPAVPGTDKSLVGNIRPVTPLVKLTDFAGNLTAGVTPDVKRQIILNEVMGDGGPAAVLVNNSYFDSELSIAPPPPPPTPYRAGGPTEFPVEGSTEIVEIINVSADAHPIHIHLLQWQLVKRQKIDDIGFLTAYANAWATKHPGILPFPGGISGMTYPGGAGTPYRYDSLNADGAVGGNPPASPFLLGAVMPASPEEQGWKDNVIVMPGEVTTFITRVAPTDRPVNATPAQLLFSFDPSQGPGYVWHCHIVDHEDMSMMRPLMIKPSVLRLPQITTQPLPVIACAGDIITYTVAATSLNLAPMTYQWQITADGGITWTNLTDVAPYTGSLTASLSITPSNAALTGGSYRCLVANNSGSVTSNAALLTVNNCSVSGTLKYNNAALDPLAGFTVTINGLTAITDAAGAFTINGVTSGAFPVTITNTLPAGGINSTDAGRLSSWLLLPAPIPNVSYLAGDVNNDLAITVLDPPAIQQNFALRTPFIKAPWVYSDALGTGIINPPALSVTVSGTSVPGFNILAMSTGDFNSSFNPNAISGGSNILLTNSGLTVSAVAGKQFDLPLKSVFGGQVGAISLVLNIPSNFVTVKNVAVPGSTGPVTFGVLGNELRIGWNSTIPINVLPGGNLVVITLMPTATLISGTSMTIGIVQSDLNELADGAFNRILNADLTVDNVMVATQKGNTLAVSAAPNPATTTTTVTYTIPVAGNVSLGIYDSKGIALSLAVLNNQPMLAGTYIQVVDLTTLIKGNYYIRLTLAGSLSNQISSIKLIKK